MPIKGLGDIIIKISSCDRKHSAGVTKITIHEYTSTKAHTHTTHNRFIPVLFVFASQDINSVVYLDFIT